MNKNKHDLTLCRTYMSPIVATSSALGRYVLWEKIKPTNRSQKCTRRWIKFKIYLLKYYISLSGHICSFNKRHTRCRGIFNHLIINKYLFLIKILFVSLKGRLKTRFLICWFSNLKHPNHIIILLISLIVYYSPYLTNET